MKLKHIDLFPSYYPVYSKICNGAYDKTSYCAKLSIRYLVNLQISDTIDFIQIRDVIRGRF